MRVGLNILTAFLHSLKTRKLLSSSRNTYLPNIFVRRNPRLAAQAARLRATKSAGRIRTRPVSVSVSAAPSFTSTAADRTAPRRRDSRSGTRRRRPYTRHLQRNTNAAAQVPSYPQPPGAYVCALGGVPKTPAGDNEANHPAPLVTQKVFFDALYKERAVLLRAADERRAREREAAEAEAQARLRRAEEDAEYLRLLAEDRRKAQEAQGRAEAEAAAARWAEEQRRAEEEMVVEERRRRRKREAEERRRRHAAREERRERERREQEERHEQETLRRRAAADATLAQRVTEWHHFYEERWAVLRADVRLRPLGFSDIPWPLFGIATSGEDITLLRIQEFLCHPQREAVQSAGQAKSIRSEMLRWHPDKFNGKVLNMVVEGDREAVKEAAGNVARILTQLATEMQGR